MLELSLTMECVELVYPTTYIEGQWVIEDNWICHVGCVALLQFWKSATLPGVRYYIKSLKKNMINE